MKIRYPFQYHGWSNCVLLSNDIVDLIATTDVGPRIMRFGFKGEQNEFFESADTLGQTGGEEWHSYGGHRLWHAPENIERTYFPDNSPIKYEDHGNFIRLVQPVEPNSAIQKEIDLFLSPDSTKVQIVHRLNNQGLWPIELAPWAISVMAPGGIAIAPFPPRGQHPEALLPVNSLSLWAYTDMSDPRWTWGHEYLMLQQDPSIELPQKVGMLSNDGWVAFANNGHLFIKAFNPDLDYFHPDFNSNIEFFTNQNFLELETLGAMNELEPDASIEYIEHWYLFDNIPQPKSESEVIRSILPALESIF